MKLEVNMSTSTSLQPIGILAPGANLNAYVQAVSSFSILTVEEEQELARDLVTNGNLDAARKLVMAHLRFVVHIARSYNGYGLPLGDLVQEGNVGLMKDPRATTQNHKVASAQNPASHARSPLPRG